MQEADTKKSKFKVSPLARSRPQRKWEYNGRYYLSITNLLLSLSLFKRDAEGLFKFKYYILKSYTFGCLYQFRENPLKFRR